MGDMADDYEHQQWQENSRYHSELNPRGVKTSDDFVWTMRDGKKIKLADMETSHIKNCMRMLNRAIASRPDEYAWGEPEGDMAQDAFNAGIRENDYREEEMRKTLGIFQRELKLRGADTSAHNRESKGIKT